MVQLILASGSPRRTQLLTSIQLNHSIVVADIDETPFDQEMPEALVRRLAASKALKVAHDLEGLVGEAYVLGADTIVVHNNEILGKPVSEAEAVAMLQQLSGDWHQVMTGMCLVNIKSKEHFVKVGITNVKMKPLSLTMIKGYVASGEPMDKAGAYAIQEIGSTLVECIEGEFSTVVGLSIQTLLGLFEAFGLDYYKDLRV